MRLEVWPQPKSWITPSFSPHTDSCYACFQGLLSARHDERFFTRLIAPAASCPIDCHNWRTTCQEKSTRLLMTLTVLK